MSSEETQEERGTALSVPPTNMPREVDKPEIQKVVADLLGKSGSLVIHNFDGSPADVWRRTALASSSECRKFDELEAGKLSIVYFYAHPVEIEKPGGELIDATRIVLFDKADLPYSFVSEGVAKGLAQIIRIFGWGPYDPPIECRITKTPTRNGNIYNIVPA